MKNKNIKINMRIKVQMNKSSKIRKILYVNIVKIIYKKKEIKN